MNKKLSMTAAVLGLSLALTGCGIDVESIAKPPVEEPATTEATPEFAEPAEESAPVDDMILGFGDSMIWEDNVSMSVSAPTPFTPTEYAAGATQPESVVFRVVLKNDSSQKLEPFVYSTLLSGGVEASKIFDSSNAIGEIGGAPSTVILPGQSVTWMEAYSVTDSKDLTMQISPSFDYEDAIFTTVG